MTSEAFAPLASVRVVDLTHVLAGPYCTQMLSMLGAEVIKVEPPGTGDLTRFGGPIAELNDQQLGLAFCTQNMSKSSITVDLKTADGIEIVQRLVQTADVFIENYRPGVAERLGLGYSAMVDLKPDLVYVSLTAYGQDGPIGHRPAYDHVVQGMSGIMETTGTEETGPVKVGAPYVDYATGQKGAFATLAAVVEQRRTGQPQRIDVAMLDSTLLLMASTLAATATTGERPAKLGNEAASRAPSSGCFATADGLLMIAANNDRQFRSLCAAVGRRELADDERFAASRARSANAPAFRGELDAVLVSRTAAEWETILDEAGVPASRVRSMDELLDEGQPQARGLLTDVSVGENATTVQLPTIGFKANGTVPGQLDEPPTLGSANEAVLAELGYSADEIQRLGETGVV